MKNIIAAQTITNTSMSNGPVNIQGIGPTSFHHMKTSFAGFALRMRPASERILIYRNSDSLAGVYVDSMVYLCPMHRDVRQPEAGKCPKCGMALLPEGTRFAVVRHMFSSPLHLVVMVSVMIALMAAIMMMR